METSRGLPPNALPAPAGTPYPFVGANYQQYGEVPGYAYDPWSDEYYRDANEYRDYLIETGQAEAPPGDPSLFDTVKPLAIATGVVEGVKAAVSNPSGFATGIKDGIGAGAELVGGLWNGGGSGVAGASSASTATGGGSGLLSSSSSAIPQTPLYPTTEATEVLAQSAPQAPGLLSYVAPVASTITGGLALNENRRDLENRFTDGSVSGQDVAAGVNSATGGAIPRGVNLLNGEPVATERVDQAGLFSNAATPASTVAGAQAAGSAALAANPLAFSNPLTAALAVLSMGGVLGDDDTQSHMRNYEELDNLRNQGVYIPDNLLESAAQGQSSSRGAFREDVDEDFVGFDPEGNWVNNRFANSRDVADLRAEDIVNYGAFAHYDEDWFNRPLEERLEISQFALDRGAVGEGRGTISLDFELLPPPGGSPGSNRSYSSETGGPYTSAAERKRKRG